MGWMDILGGLERFSMRFGSSGIFSNVVEISPSL